MLFCVYNVLIHVHRILCVEVENVESPVFDAIVFMNTRREIEEAALNLPHVCTHVLITRVHTFEKLIVNVKGVLP